MPEETSYEQVLDEGAVERLTLVFDRICKVCPDRNPDGTCDRLSEGSCTLISKLPEAVEAILKVYSNQTGAYIEAIRSHVCEHCTERDADRSCLPRDTDHCMLNCYLPLLVEVVEEFFQAPSSQRSRLKPASVAQMA